VAGNGITGIKLEDLFQFGLGLNIIGNKGICVGESKVRRNIIWLHTNCSLEFGDGLQSPVFGEQLVPPLIVKRVSAGITQPASGKHQQRDKCNYGTAGKDVLRVGRDSRDQCSERKSSDKASDVGCVIDSANQSIDKAVGAEN